MVLGYLPPNFPILKSRDFPESRQEVCREPGSYDPDRETNAWSGTENLAGSADPLHLFLHLQFGLAGLSCTFLLGLDLIFITCLRLEASSFGIIKVEKHAPFHTLRSFSSSMSEDGG